MVATSRGGSLLALTNFTNLTQGCPSEPLDQHRDLVIKKANTRMEKGTFEDVAKEEIDYDKYSQVLDDQHSRE